ncbi:unnamed protein product [Amoebophrya sp. A120]|nr:unnamed protein product [Amoebophrya sp. A120]|eukprot:GSA120T00000259001.1
MTTLNDRSTKNAVDSSSKNEVQEVRGPATQDSIVDDWTESEDEKVHQPPRKRRKKVVGHGQQAPGEMNSAAAARGQKQNNLHAVPNINPFLTKSHQENKPKVDANTRTSGMAAARGEGRPQMLHAQELGRHQHRVVPPQASGAQPAAVDVLVHPKKKNTILSNVLRKTTNWRPTPQRRNKAQMPDVAADEELVHPVPGGASERTTRSSSAAATAAAAAAAPPVAGGLQDHAPTRDSPARFQRPPRRDSTLDRREIKSKSGSSYHAPAASVAALASTAVEVIELEDSSNGETRNNEPQEHQGVNSSKNAKAGGFFPEGDKSDGKKNAENYATTKTSTTSTTNNKTATNNSARASGKKIINIGTSKSSSSTASSSTTRTASAAFSSSSSSSSAAPPAASSADAFRSKMQAMQRATKYWAAIDANDKNWEILLEKRQHGYRTLSDDQLPDYVTVIRNALPENLANRLLRQVLHGDLGKKFEEKTWWVFGQAGKTPRKTYNWHRPDWDKTMCTAAETLEAVINEKMKNCRYSLVSGCTTCSSDDVGLEVLGGHAEPMEILLQPKYPLPETWRASYALGNWYRDGKDNVGPHQDSLTHLGPCPMIASLSLGAGREFVLEHRQTKEKLSLMLLHNDLLIMWPPCQEEFTHSIPKMSAPLPFLFAAKMDEKTKQKPKKLINDRVNYTFRMERPEYSALTPNCDCGRPCNLKPFVQKWNGTNFGKYLYRCNPADRKEKPCKFVKCAEWSCLEGGLAEYEKMLEMRRSKELSAAKDVEKTKESDLGSGGDGVAMPNQHHDRPPRSPTVGEIMEKMYEKKDKERQKVLKAGGGATLFETTPKVDNAEQGTAAGSRTTTTLQQNKKPKNFYNQSSSSASFQNVFQQTQADAEADLDSQLQTDERDLRIM